MSWLLYWHWFALGLCLIIAESLGAAGFLIALGMASILTGAVSLFVFITWEWQLLFFSICCLIFAYGWWKVLKKPPKHQLSLLNQPLESMVGTKTVLVEAITNGRGKVKINDAHWYVSGPELPVGMRVKVTGVDASGLLVVEAIFE